MSILMQNEKAIGGGATLASELTAIDTEGIIGTAGAEVTGQALLDGLAERSKDINNSLANQQVAIRANGAHNLLCPNPSYIKSVNTDGTWADNVFTRNGVSFTINSDYSITVNGTASAFTFFVINNIAAVSELLESGVSYKLSGCPQNGSSNSYQFYFGETVESGDGVIVTKPFSGNNIGIGIAKNYACNNLVFKPMILHPADEDTTYAPGAMTNRELTDHKADQTDLASIHITGSTNTTGSTITAGTYFYKDGALVRAKADIANGATLTVNTNYEVVNGFINATPMSMTTGIAGVAAYKCGKVVTLRGVIDRISTTTAGWKTIGTLPTALMPVMNVYFPAFDNNATSREKTSLQMNISSIGEIKIWLFANESAVPYWTVTYLTA